MVIAKSGDLLQEHVDNTLEALMDIFKVIPIKISKTGRISSVSLSLILAASVEPIVQLNNIYSSSGRSK